MATLKELENGIFLFLKHITRDKNIVKILKSGYLLTWADLIKNEPELLREAFKHKSDYPGVYMSLSSSVKYQRSLFNPYYGDIALIFSLNILHNQNNYHLNPYDYYGAFVNSFYPEQYTEFNNLTSHRDIENYANYNEIVFHDKVSLSYLRYIVVGNDSWIYNKFTSVVSKIKKLLKNNNLDNYIPLVISYKDFKSKFLDNHKLIDTPDISEDSRDKNLPLTVDRRDKCIFTYLSYLDFKIKNQINNYDNDINSPEGKLYIKKITNEFEKWMDNYIEDLNENPEDKIFIFNLIEQCGIKKSLLKRKLDIKKMKNKPFTKKELTIIKEIVFDQYYSYMSEKYNM